jgi:hypothetical protein
MIIDGKDYRGVQCSQTSIGGLLDTALAIAAERRETLQSMRAAFERGDVADAVRFARKLCGLDADDEASDRAN